jgi:hypothetical protein
VFSRTKSPLLRFGTDAVQCGFFFVDNEYRFRLVCSTYQPTSTTRGVCLKILARLFGKREPYLLGWIIDFRDQRL